MGEAPKSWDEVNGTAHISAVAQRDESVELLISALQDLESLSTIFRNERDHEFQAPLIAWERVRKHLRILDTPTAAATNDELDWNELPENWEG